MTAPAIVYDHIPGNISDEDSECGEKDYFSSGSALMKASLMSEGDDIYETIIDDVSDFVMVPRAMIYSDVDHDLDFHCQNDTTNVVVEGQQKRKPRGMVAWIRRRLVRTVRYGWEWVTETSECWQQRMLVPAASSAIQSYEWEPEEVETSIHGKSAYLKIPGPLIIFGDPVCITVPHDDDILLNPPSTGIVMDHESSTTKGKQKKIVDGERLTPVTIMVSARDLLAASPHPTTTPPIPCDVDPLLDTTESTAENTSTVKDILYSNSSPNFSVQSLRITKALIRQVKLGGKLLVKSTKKRTLKVLTSSSSIFSLAGTQIMDWERRYEMLGTASQLVYNSYEWVLQRQPLRSERDKGEEAAIELTS